MNIKNLMLTTIAFLTVLPAFSAQIKQRCLNKAVTATYGAVDSKDYDDDGLSSNGCELAPNQKAIICEVSALKGGGDASDTYRVVLNLSCTKAYRVELIGEE